MAEVVAEVLADEEDAEEVALGALETDDGELGLRHVVSSVVPTSFISESPPVRPLESTIVNNIDVPPATSAGQSNSVGPTGGFKMNVVPPGMTPCTRCYEQVRIHA